MSLAERRTENRITLQVPFEYRSMSNPVASMRKALTKNISPRGILFSTDYPFLVGSEAEITLEFPKAITGKEPMPVRCLARVMHVERSQNGAQVDVGVFIERMESARVYTAPAVRARPGAAGAI